MSIASDRKAISDALRTGLGQHLTVLDYAPATAQPLSAWLDLVSVAPGKTFRSLTATWEVIITTTASARPDTAATALDGALDRAIAAIVASGAADLDNVGAYIGLTNNSSGGVIPAARITLKSSTPVKGME
ncbi:MULTISPECIES: hypothetical protein [unclassified Actinotignum]|uniref:hypothetical protein n=1 Tax=unclassified Actinotignum TaxID=2632702 RepID=UPI002A7F50E5|nr:hypothetical protein [Actinotignum sp. SLA_B059]MDY5127462.1 hypothetical protein [Actinotignum sp. SLA_B059]